jgi:hypothetical protein
MPRRTSEKKLLSLYHDELQENKTSNYYTGRKPEKFGQREQGPQFLEYQIEYNDDGTRCSKQSVSTTTITENFPGWRF